MHHERPLRRGDRTPGVTIQTVSAYHKPQCKPMIAQRNAAVARAHKTCHSHRIPIPASRSSSSQSVTTIRGTSASDNEGCAAILVCIWLRVALEATKSTPRSYSNRGGLGSLTVQIGLVSSNGLREYIQIHRAGTSTSRPPQDGRQKAYRSGQVLHCGSDGMATLHLPRPFFFAM